MDIILLEDLNKVGEKYDIVKVKNGYGRNYLIPQGLAMVANKTNLDKLDVIKTKESDRLAAIKGEVEAMAAKLNGETIKLGAKTGTSGKIFGSVTSVQVANAIKENYGYEVDRRKIVLPTDITEVGTYPAKINIHKEVPIEINLEIIGE